MLETLRPAVVMFVVLSVLTGLIYPFAIAGVGQLAFPSQANGSLVMRDGKVIGSSLIGQTFTDDKYFWPRPSATSGPDPKDPGKAVAMPYNANNSTGSNLGPTSKVLMDRIALDAKRYQVNGKVPTDLATASGSGLDPHISPAAALYQVPRVAKSRNMSEDAVRKLVADHTASRDLGFLGEPTVNVLALNLALDDAQRQTNGRSKP